MLDLFLHLHLTESTYRHQANIDDEVVTMDILDTAGQVRAIILLLELHIFCMNILDVFNPTKKYLLPLTFSSNT